MAGNSSRGARRTLPYGPWGIAALMAVLGGLAGLLMPLAWIDEVSWQLYLDQIIAAARPPLGTTARLVAAAVLALGLGVIGWIIAKLLGVRTSAGGIADWIVGLRGLRADDEPDAPSLRSADRHPDAPARRPFSASRDVSVDEEPLLDSGWEASDADEELLLDAHFDETFAPTVEADPERAERWETLELVDEDVAAETVTVASTVETNVDDDAQPAPVEAALPAQALDLSIARLDELIARLEAGLTRKQAATSISDHGVSAVAEGSAVLVNDPQPLVAPGEGVASEDVSFPHDPALAAALATLRRMNRSS